MRMIKSILLPLVLFILAAVPALGQEIFGWAVNFPNNRFVNNAQYIGEGANDCHLIFSKADGTLYLTLQVDNKNKFFPIDKYGPLTFQYAGGESISLPVSNDFEIILNESKWSETTTNHRLTAHYETSGEFIKAVTVKKPITKIILPDKNGGTVYDIDENNGKRIAKGLLASYDGEASKDPEIFVSKSPAAKKSTGGAGTLGETVHETGNTRTVTVMTDPTFNVSPCSGGIFSTYNPDTKETCVYNLQGKQLGRIYLDYNFRHPVFRNGGPAPVKLRNGHPAIINPDGTVLKEFPEGLEISHSFEDGVGLIEVQHPATRQKLIAYINDVGEQIYGNLIQEDPGYVANLDVYPLRNGLRRHFDYKTKLYGYIDKNGSIVIPAKYTEAHEFSELCAAVAVGRYPNQTWGFIGTGGETKVSFGLSREPGDFHDGFAKIKKANQKFVYIAPDGKIRTRELNYATRFFNGYAFINGQGQYGPDNGKSQIISVLLTTVKEIKYMTANEDDFHYDEKKGTFVHMKTLYSSAGQALLHLSDGRLVHYFDDGIALYKSNSMIGFINNKGEVLLKLKKYEF